jgi:hypothetical protein
MRFRRSVPLLLLLACTPLFAQERAERKTGFTFQLGQPDSGIAVRRVLTPSWMVLGTLMYAHGSSASGAGGGGVPAPAVDQTTWGVGAAIRRVFVSEELRPFAQIEGAWRRSSLSSCGNTSYPYVAADGGVEYFVARRVSIEGSAGVSHARFSEQCSDGTINVSFSSNSTATFRSAISLTFYF